MSGIQQMLLGGSGVTISLPNYEYGDVDLTLDPVDAFAGINVRDDGILNTVSGDDSPDYSWCNPVEAVAGYLDYEFRLTKSTGSDPSIGTLNTWIAASLNPGWTWIRTSVGSLLFTGTLEVRPPSGSTLDSCSVDIEAEVNI